MRRTGGAARRTTVAVALLAFLALAAACGESGDDSSEDAASTETDSSAAEPVSTTPPPASVTGDPLAGDSGVLDIDPLAPGAERHIYRYGPIDIEPGQNNIDFTGPIELPTEDGWITRIAADVQREDGSVPPVDIIHLHHGVWINQSRSGSGFGPELVFAAGEEKTITHLPDGYGYRFDHDDTWIINFMIHNQIPAPDEVYLSYTVDLIPTDAPEAADISEAHPVWMDVQSGQIYPVFDVPRGGADDQYTYPDDATDPYGTGRVRNQWTVPTDGVLLGTGGHVHPGGRHTDLFVTRAGATAENDDAAEYVDGDTALAFRSEAEYFDPNGPVSWDLAAHTTSPDWRVGVQAGDVLSISATYDTEQALAYEAMGIMVVWMADGEAGPDPFETPVAADEGQVTHGHLAENDNHGGDPNIFDGDVSALPSGQQVSTIPIEDFAYQYGDLSEGEAEVPTVPQGQSIEFDNTYDNERANGIWHTITACLAPCSGATGISYPLANSPTVFDSGELGTGGEPTANRVTWSTPANLDPGTYTYFCRIHPFMRGAFRVTPS
jgi:plastocyanin